MKSILVTMVFLLPLIIIGQDFHQEIYETDNLKFIVTSDCRILPFEGQFLKEEAKPGMIDELSFVMASKDPAGNNLLSLNFSHYIKENQYVPGIVIDEFNSVKLDTVFKVSKEDILAHIEDFEDNGVIDNPIPSIFGWPARGNRFFKDFYNIDLTSVSTRVALAPFENRLSNQNTYEPDKGDFPMFRLDVYFQEKVLPEFIYFTSVCLDPEYWEGNQTTIGMTTYNLECEEGSNINNTFFTDYSISNMGINDGNCVGSGIKNKLSDNESFVSSTMDEMAYMVMDSDKYDFGAYVQQMIRTSSLASSMDRNCENTFDTIDFKSKFDNVNIMYKDTLSTVHLDYHSTMEEYHNVLTKGMWPDGTSMTVGGEGYSIDSEDTTYFAFQGDLLVENDWNEYSAETVFGKKDAIYSSTFQAILQAGSRSDFRSYAHTFLPKSSRDDVYTAIEKLRDIYFLYIWNTERDWNLDLCEQPLNSTSKETAEINIFPNPTNQISMFSKVMDVVSVYDISGKLLAKETDISSFDLSKFPVGLYIFYLNFKNKLIMKKVIKI